MSIEDKRIPRTPEEEAAGVFQVEDIGEAQTRAATEKSFRDAAKGKSDTDKEVLNRVADEQGNKAGQEYRETKEASPSEVIKRLSKELEEKLEADPIGRAQAEAFPGYFAKFVGELKAQRLELGGRVKEVGVLFLPNFRTGLNLNNQNFNKEAWQNALYSVLGVGESIKDVLDTYRKLPESRKDKVAAEVAEKVGNPTATADYAAQATLPTKIDGVFLSVLDHPSYKETGVALKFSREFLERAMK